nr:PREDICTED: SURP and G-patch domain-containing protein 2 isoform X2 [Anolis carolinensis]|eukprot:XP_008119542.1 PREDICTED: SURP and G-patch domain-containing protein 2 isoform X2 [Anolis carolinensis]
MASRRLTREAFEALAQTKAKQFHLDQSDAIDVALRQLRAQTRPVPRTQYDDDEGDFRDDGKFGTSDWREELRDDYSLPTYRSGSQVAEEDDYYDKSSSQQAPRGRDYLQQEYGHSSSAERDYRDRNYSRLASREQDYGHNVLARELSKRHNASYGSAELLGDFRGSLGALEETARGSNYNMDFRIGREFGLSLPVGRGRGMRGKRGATARNNAELAIPAQKWGAKNVPLADATAVVSQRPRLFLNPVENEFKLKPADPTDIFSTFGMEIIKWAGFDEIQHDLEYAEHFRALFTLETETCAKMLASFKCSLKSEHQRFCLSSVKMLQHLALKAPKVDSQFLSLLMEKKVMAKKNDFFEVIGPFDRYVMRLQHYMLKSATPLLMACNGYELSMKSSGVNKPAQVPVAFETTVSLCRKALALLGQTFALATAFRQEKILEALSIQEAAPPATSFPNFDTSALFGKEYIEHLKGWLEKSGCQMRLKLPPADTPPESARNASETRPKIKIPQRADRKVISTVEKLVDDIVSGLLSEKEKAELSNNPDYWFLQEEESLEHKYYKLKLSEAERLAAKSGSRKEEEEEEEGWGSWPASMAPSATLSTWAWREGQRWRHLTSLLFIAWKVYFRDANDSCIGWRARWEQQLGAELQREKAASQDEEEPHSCEYQVLVLGLDGAGKSSIIHYVCNTEAQKDIAPTQGFNSVQLQANGLQLDLLEVGGSQNLRFYWNHYLSKAHVLVFVVDSADGSRLPIAQQELHCLLSEDSQLPLIVLANKQGLAARMTMETEPTVWWKYCRGRQSGSLEKQVLEES